MRPTKSLIEVAPEELERLIAHQLQKQLKIIEQADFSNPRISTFDGFLREKQILGDRKAIPPIIPILPISSSTWWAGVKSGRYPKPVRHYGVTMWKISDIERLIKEIEKEGQAGEL